MSGEANNKKSVVRKIRVARVSDALELAKLRYAFRSSTGKAIEDENAFVERCKPWMAERLNKGSLWRCWVAEGDQTLIGSLWLQLIEKIPNPTSEREYHAYITSVYVFDWARGKGVGSELLSTALTWCKSAGAHAVILWSRERSRPLYERHGFAVHSDLLELIVEEPARETVDLRRDV